MMAAQSGIAITEPERTEVLDAMVALRRKRDPARAGVLLDRYLVAHPRGALHEEALALAIEAASARGDRAAARNLSQAYQARYPQGRFLRFASSQADAPTP
jgi:Tfp pilus assembly protein PilF